MRTPGFWYRPPELLAALLSPLGWLYWQVGQLRRLWLKPQRLGVPLIVVGNVVAGGAGKTPVALALADHLIGQGQRVHFIAKGYGGTITKPTRVDPVLHSAAAVGDEPLLLAAKAPTWIGKDRWQTARAAAEGADVVISDDGLQNPALLPDLALLVMDGVVGIGNGRLIPAGPLREPFADAATRCQAIVQLGGQVPARTPKPVILADAVAPKLASLRGQRLVPFAGIGRPEKFFAMLTTSGAQVVGTFSYADHHAYRAADLAELTAYAKDHQAALITTSKDAARLPPAFRQSVMVLEIELHWRDPAALSALLQPLIGTRAAP